MIEPPVIKNEKSLAQFRWFWVWLGGLMLLILATGAFILYYQSTKKTALETNDRNEKNGLIARTLNKQVDQLISDPSGHIWAVTGNKIENLTSGNTIDFPITNDPQPLISIEAFDQTGRLWISSYTDQSNILVYDPKSGWDANFPSLTVDALVIDDQSVAWALSGSDLVMIDSSTHTESTVRDGISGLAVDHKGRLWIIENTSVIMHEQDGTWTTVTAKPELQYWEYSTHPMLFDSNNRLWIALESGVSMLGTDGTWTDFMNKEIESDYPSLISDQKDRLWLSSSAPSIYMLDLKNGWTIIEPKNSGIPDSSIVGIAVDSQGWVWVATWQGISVINDDTIQIVRFSTSIQTTGLRIYWGTLGWLTIGFLGIALMHAKQASTLGQVGLGFILFIALQLLLVMGMNSPLGPSIDFGWLLIIPTANIILLGIMLLQSGKAKWVAVGYILPLTIFIVFHAGNFLASVLLG